MSTPGSVIPLLLGSAAPPYEIERSLRFNSSDSAFLSRTPASAGNRKTWTWAGWVKRSSLGSFQMIFGGGTTSNDTDQFVVYFTTGDTLRITSGVTIFRETSQVFRDPSSWYHLIVAVDTTQSTANDRIKFYVNGTQVTTFSTTNNPTQNADTGINTTTFHAIGRNSLTPEYYFSGYLSDIYFVDGQQLTPSSLVEVSATTGQLIPKAYTGSFGTNGFWLKFSDNSAATATTLGKDYSGNSNNWTPNNFNVLSSYTDTFLSRKPDGTSWTNPTYAFDGTTANYADGTAGNGTVSTIRFNKPLTGVTLLEYFYDGTSTYGYNSTDVGTGPNLTGGSWVTVYSGSAITVNNVRCTSQPGNGVIRLYAIRVNGTILNNWTETDPPGCDSTVDTPTSYGTDTGVGGEVRGNYCTLNPLVTGQSSPSIANGNLDWTLTQGTILATFGLSTGKYYWEVTANASNLAVGIALANVDKSIYLGYDGRAWAYYSTDGSKYNNYPVNGTVSYGAAWTTGDIIGIAFDADNGTLTFYKNGVSQGTAFTGLTSGPYFPAVGNASSAGSCNFGQRPFAYPVSGFKALCDTNLPAPVVAKSSDYFQTVLYTGNGSSRTISGLGFSPDLVWIKPRSVAEQHELYNTISGPNKALFTDYTDAETTITDNGLNAFNSDGFSLGSRGYVNGSGKSYVAWCWDAGSSTVTNNAGSISAQVRSNPAAGFSICTYITSGSGTVGHGLNVTPAISIAKRRDAASSWYFRFVAGGVNTVLLLNSTGAGSSSSTFTSAVVNGADFGTSNEQWILYNFAPVAGYSSFGSYVGNGSSDGPFQWCGFRPRWVLYKESSVAGSSWEIIDAARNPYNASNARLFPDSSGAENTAQNALDLLSNGFKPRATYGGNNASGATYIWAAFAESPFQYARAR